MRVAVAGGTGLVGRQVVTALTKAGHEPVVLSRSAGIDLTTGEGVAGALEGSSALIDVTNTLAFQPEQAEAFFGTVTANLLEAERDAGVQHHVVLSILGVDRVTGNGHYAGKRLQERLARHADMPATIVRATQFFEFAEMVARWTLRDNRAIVAPLLVQPLAVHDLAQVLANIALDRPSSQIVDVAGPAPHDLVDMARRTLTARGMDITIVPSWRGPFSVEMAGEALLPDDTALRTTTTFEQWLTALTPAAT